MSHEHPIWKMLDRMQMDNREQAAKLIELRAIVADLSLPDPKRLICATCGIGFRGVQQVQEHAYNSHSGPVPEHYLIAERLAGLETTSDLP